VPGARAQQALMPACTNVYSPAWPGGWVRHGCIPNYATDTQKARMTTAQNKSRKASLKKNQQRQKMARPAQWGPQGIGRQCCRSPSAPKRVSQTVQRAAMRPSMCLLCCHSPAAPAPFLPAGPGFPFPPAGLSLQLAPAPAVPNVCLIGLALQLLQTALDAFKAPRDACQQCRNGR